MPYPLGAGFDNHQAPRLIVWGDAVRVRFALLTGLVFWLVTIAYTAIILALSATPIWPPRFVSALHFGFSLTQGSLAFAVFDEFRQLAKLRFSNAWRAGILYGVFLWTAGVVPMGLTDVAARYLVQLPVGNAIAAIVTRFGLLILLGTICSVFAIRADRLRTAVQRTELQSE